jgi:hypothetical protein
VGADAGAQCPLLPRPCCLLLLTIAALPCACDRAGARDGTCEQRVTGYVRRFFPGKILIAEDLAGMPDIHTVAGFDSQWDNSFFYGCYRCIVARRDADRNIHDIVHALKHRFIGTGLDRVIYAESHDTVCDDRYAASESLQVASKCARSPRLCRCGVSGRHMTTRLNVCCVHRQGRLAAKVAAAVGADDTVSTLKRCVLAAALLLTTPGIPMLTQVRGVSAVLCPCTCCRVHTSAGMPCVVCGCAGPGAARDAGRSLARADAVPTRRCPDCGQPRGRCNCWQCWHRSGIW